MRDSHRNAMRRRLLTAAIAPLLASALTPASAVVPLFVTDCGDGAESGTLRNVIAGAAAGSIVDVTACSTITLDTGKTSIAVAQNDLTIGNASAHTTIDASALPSGPTKTDENRVLTHTGSGTLRLSRVNLKGGHVAHSDKNAEGGCLSSQGNVEIDAGDVYSCSAYTSAPAESGPVARGGGIYATGSVTLTDSTVSSNTANSQHGYASGGGVFSKGSLDLGQSVILGNRALAAGSARGAGLYSSAPIHLGYATVNGNEASTYSTSSYGGGIFGANVDASYSTIDGNLADGGAGAGGGIYALGSLTLRKCTVSNNHAAALGGIVAFTPGPANTSAFNIVSSTVSGNTSESIGAGIGTNASVVKIYNSTIAFNAADGAAAHGQVYAPGLALNALGTPMAVTLSSTLIANNTYGAGIEFDLSTANGDPGNPITFTGQSANNLVVEALVPDSTGFPPDTLAGSCPRLGPLRDNGGPTWTHALLSGSPGLDAGNNVLDLLEDQRGVDLDSPPYPFPRVLKATAGVATADIGAYEFDADETIFAAGFDGCPPLD